MAKTTRTTICLPRLRHLILAIVLCFSATQLMAQTEKKISLKVNNAPLSQVLTKIEDLSGCKVSFTYDEVQQYRVSVNMKNQPVSAVMQQVLKDTPLEYTVKGKFITVFKGSKLFRPQASPTSGASARTVKGTVRDADGEPLIGVTVQVEGTNKGTVTDYDGNFVLEGVEEGEMLTYSYVGKRPLKRHASYKPVVIILEDESALLDDVVVTGYQTISRERAAGSYNIVRGEEVDRHFLSTNSVIDGLEGKVTGLSINRNEHQDRYLIRGTTSINSERAPLFVVDGIPMEASLVEEMISSKDIANITILKDATAASIWGAQAANGVVVISTKKGEYDSKVRVNYGASITSYGKPDYDYYGFMDNQTFMKNAQEMFDIYSDTYSYATIQKSASGATANSCAHTSAPVIWPHERLMYQYKNGEITQDQRDAGLSALMVQEGRSQYEDLFMSNKFFTQHHVNVSGGNQKSKYYLSLDYKGDQGTYKDWNNRININAYQDYQIAKWLKWDVTINATYLNKKAHLSPFSESGGTTLGGRMFSEDAYNEFTGSFAEFSYTNLPYQIFRNNDGWIDQSPYVLSDEKRAMAEEATGIDLTFHPVDDFYKSVNNTNSTNLRLNTGLTANLLKGLRYEGRFHFSRINSKTETFRPQDTYYVRYEKTLLFNTSTGSFRTPTSGGNFGLHQAVTTDWTLRNQLVYDQEYEEGTHQITGLIGTEIRSYKTTAYNNSIRGYNMQTMQAEQYDQYALSSGFISPVTIGSYASVIYRDYEQSETAKKYFSLYANASYTYLSRYVLNTSLRMDQSNLFGSDPSNQYKPIWSIGAAWKISEESFMKGIDWVNELRLRASYGFAGNSPLPGTGGKYDILSATTDSRYPGPGYNIVTPANKKLTWEKTRTINLGSDTSLLNNRIRMSFDYYNKYTTDLIGTLMLNPTTGWLSTIGNVGELSNRGVELSINIHNIRSKSFNWHTELNLSYNKNRIEKQEVEKAYTLATDMLSAAYIQDYPVGALFSYRYAGLDERGFPQAYDKEGNIVQGANINSLTNEDVVYSGTTIPTVTGGLSNTFSYKNLELSFMMSYSFGNKMRKDADLFIGRVGSGLKKETDQRWRQPGDELTTDVPAYIAIRNSDYVSNAFLYADTRILDASYIKLRDISLTYTLPQRFVRRIHVNNIQITGQVGNLFIIPFNSEGIDPEYFNLRYPSYYSRSEKYGQSFSLALNISF